MMAPSGSKRPRLSEDLDEMNIVKELLDWCYDNSKIHSKKDNLLHWACEKGHVQIIKYLFEENRADDVNCLGYNDETPLHKATRNGNKELVEYLVDNGANCNAKNTNGQMPIHLLSLQIESQQKVEIANILVGKGANVWHKDSNDDSPLILDKIVNLGEQFLKAASDGNLELCKLLQSLKSLQHGFTQDLVKCQNFADGNTPLHLATKNCEKNSTTDHYNVVKYLIENGAKVDMKNEEKNRPLHYAKCKEVAELLLKHGAETYCKNKMGQTPKDTSIENKAFDVTEILIRYETKMCNRCTRSKNETFAFLPCGHAKTCELCCKNILEPANEDPLCPDCQQPITTYQKIII